MLLKIKTLRVKINRKKTVPVLIAALNSSQKQLVSLSTVKNRLRSDGLSGSIAIKKVLFPNVNRQNIVMGKKHKNWTLE